MGNTQPAPRRGSLMTRAVHDARSCFDSVAAEARDNTELSWERNRQLLKKPFYCLGRLKCESK